MKKEHPELSVSEIEKLAEMEIIPSDNYTQDNQNLFLYVKNIDK